MQIHTLISALLSSIRHKVWTQHPHLAPRRVAPQAGHLLQELPEDRGFGCRQAWCELLYDRLTVSLAASFLKICHNALTELVRFLNLHQAQLLDLPDAARNFNSSLQKQR